MRVRVIDYNKSNNRYSNIKLLLEDGTVIIATDTSDLRLKLSRNTDWVPDNFEVHPNFKVFGNVRNRNRNNNTGTNNNLALRQISNDLTRLLNDVNSINSQLNSVSHRINQGGTQLPAVVNMSTIETRLDNLDLEVKNILRHLGIVEHSIINRSKKIEDKLIAQNKTVSKAFTNLNRRLDPMFDYVQEQIYKDNHETYSYPYPKCKNDRHTWRYDSLPDIATHFSLDRNGKIKGAITNEAEASFNAINNPDSNIHLDFDADLIASARSYLEIYDKCRKYSASLFSSDSGNIKEADSIANDVAYYAAAGSMASSIITSGANYLNGALLCDDLAKVILGVFGAAGIAVSKLTYHTGKELFDDLGVKNVRIKARAGHLDDNVDFKGSVLSSNKEYLENTLSTGNIHNTASDKSKYLTSDGLFDESAFLSAMLYSCRCFTIESLNALVKRRDKKVFASDCKDKEFDKYLDLMNTKGIFEDDRLMLVYLKYYQQPYFGYNTKITDAFDKEKNATKAYIQGGTQVARKALFDCLQNAYFASKALLFLFEESSRLPIRRDRILWLNNINLVNNNNRNAMLSLKKLLEYMKLCLCIQNLSPLCADKLLQMFCNYGNIDYDVTTNTDKSFDVF